MNPRLFSTVALLALAGCSFEPAYHRPAPAIPTALPPAGQPAEAAPATLNYREIFLDPNLVRLIDQALAYNQDLKAAYANILAARALVGVQQSDLLPQIGGVASDSTGDSSNRTRSNNNSNNGGTSNSNGGGNGASSGGRRTTYTA